MENNTKLRIIYFGTSYFSKIILQALIENDYNVVALFTRPDLPRGRNQEIEKNPVRLLAEQKQIPIYTPIKLDDLVVTEIKKIKPDIIILAAYGKLLPREILDIPGFGCLNVHASLLPKYRGPSPIQNVLLNGEKETGVTIIQMNKGIDTGNILAKEKIIIESEDNAQTLEIKIAELGAKLLLKILLPWVERKIEPIKQNDAEATVCQLIEREDGKIIWENEAEKIYNMYRAFYPWPGIFTFWKQKEQLTRIKLTRISLQKNDPETKYEVGQVFQLGDKIGVQCLKGIIIIEELQLEGKKNMLIQEFLNGHSDFIGSNLV